MKNLPVTTVSLPAPPLMRFKSWLFGMDYREEVYILHDIADQATGLESKVLQILLERGHYVGRSVETSRNKVSSFNITIGKEEDVKLSESTDKYGYKDFYIKVQGKETFKLGTFTSIGLNSAKYVSLCHDDSNYKSPHLVCDFRKYRNDIQQRCVNAIYDTVVNIIACQRRDEARERWHESRKRLNETMGLQLTEPTSE